MSQPQALSRSSARATLADWLLVATVLTALFLPMAMAAMVLAVVVRGPRLPRLQGPLVFLAGSIAWAVVVMTLRGVADSGGVLVYFGFLWVMPWLIACYGPDEHTVRRFGHLLIGLFLVDLAFNLFTMATGADLLGRALDVREGVVGGRGGGLFAHSFYSGSISIAALLTLASRSRMRGLIMLPILNLLLAGSFRFAAALAMLWLFSWGWQRRTRLAEAGMIALCSLLLVVSVIATAGLVDTGGDSNPSNLFRVFAWVTAIDKVVTAPLFGVGFPNEAIIQEVGVSFETLDEHLVAESWYLSSAITFGLPYTVLYLAALLSAFYGRGFAARDFTRAVLFPYIVTDLTYGSFFGGVLIYSWLWILVFAGTARSKRQIEQQPAAAKMPLRTITQRPLVDPAS
jgi:hypothetical protein